MNNKYAKDLNLLLLNAESIIEHPTQRKTALLKIKLNTSHIKILKEFEQNSIQFYTEINSISKGRRTNLSDLEIDEIVTIDLSPSFLKTNLNFCFYFKFDDFIAKNNTSINDEYYYIFENKLSSFNETDQHLNTYKIIVQLQNIFNDISDDTDTNTGYITYTIFDTKKIKINSDFNSDDINLIIERVPDFGNVVDNLFTDLEVVNEKKIRTLFFKKALESTFVEKNLTMSNILMNIERVFEEYESHYRAYINSLEPEKIKHKFQEEHTTFLKELNTVLGDVHNKIVFIPIAFIFGASQLTSGGWEKGLIIVIGMLIFSLFISFFLDTHKKVVDIITNKLNERDTFYKENEPALYSTYKSKIKELIDLTNSINTRISITRYSNWFLTLIAAITFYSLNN